MSLDTSSAPDDVATLSEMAQDRGLRIAVVESLTAGGLAHAVGAGEKASEWFAGGIVAYMVDVKERLLGLTPGTDPCSPECAEQLATGGRELFDADICVSTTGVGGPDPEGPHPAGTVYLGWSVEGDQGHKLLEVDGSPEDVMAAAIAAATELLVSHGEKIRA
ncbi:PncC family amidohydrolase [Microbacterium ginsengiterrae]|uniref:PncC family amidohydrolase n=1 Tax=Microbacterium ginsengiterrae TaxID=546115 RepID=A0A7W9CCR3_9MICO|nr:CinA family protein [Microbacterium ginsengiterrae]MBB5743212.1 PncC family amidohydrolase [Microbacterium ginsengiterrae]